MTASQIRPEDIFIQEDTLNGIETSVDSKDDLKKVIKEGKVYSYSERIIRFYFPNKEQA